MAYVKQTWTDRVVEFARRFTYTQDETHITLTPEPGTVTEVGTPVDASRLNHIEDGIKAIDDNLNLVDSTVASHLADNANKAHGGNKYATAIKNATQSLANATLVNIVWGTTTHNTLGIFDISNPTRLTVPENATKVKLKASLRYSAGTGNRILILLKNNENFSPQPRATGLSVTSAATTLQVMSPILDVIPGDFFELQGYQNSGGALDVTDDVSSWFTLEVVE